MPPVSSFSEKTLGRHISPVLHSLERLTLQETVLPVPLPPAPPAPEPPAPLPLPPAPPMPLAPPIPLPTVAPAPPPPSPPASSPLTTRDGGASKVASVGEGGLSACSVAGAHAAVSARSK